MASRSGIRRKLCPLNVVQGYIGSDRNLSNKSVSLPNEKGSYHRPCRVMAGTESKVFSKRRFGTPRVNGLCGIHFSPHKTIPGIPSIITFGESLLDPRAHLHPPRALKRDLTWIHCLLPILSNTMPLSRPDPIDLDWSMVCICSEVKGECLSWHWFPEFTRLLPHFENILIIYRYNNVCENSM